MEVGGTKRREKNDVREEEARPSIRQEPGESHSPSGQGRFERRNERTQRRVERVEGRKRIIKRCVRGQGGEQDSKRETEQLPQRGEGELDILYLNAQSILSKIPDLEATSSIVKPDLICITEAWTNDNISDNVLNITNYELISDLRRDRNDTKDGRGGGLLVYVKQGLNILPIDKDNDFNQYVSFDVLNSENIVCKHVILAYRPPNSPSTNNEKICDIVKNAPKNTLLIGDINFPKIDWDNLTCDNRGKDFMNVCIDHNFTQYIDFPTCNRPPFNTLDLVLSNDNSIISTCAGKT